MYRPRVLGEAVKSKLDVDPLSGEEVEKIVAGLSKLGATLVAIRRILAAHLMTKGTRSDTIRS